MRNGKPYRIKLDEAVEVIRTICDIKEQAAID